MYHIVIADDEQLERMVLRQALEEYLGERCVVRVAANGREAVELALLTGADLAILDIEMPGIDGLEAARMILQKLPRCKIIMLTAYSEFEYARKAISFGSADYLLKPCADEELHRTLDRVLGQIDEHREGEAERERSTRRIHTLSLQLEEQIVRTVMGGHITPAYILAQMRNYGVEFASGVFAILYSNGAHSESDIVSALKGGAKPAHLHPFVYCYDGRVYLVNVSDEAAADCLSATQNQLTLLSQAANTLWGHPLYAAIGVPFTGIQYAQLSCFQAQVALSRCTDAHPVNTYEEGEADSSAFTDNPILNSVLYGDVEEIGRVASSVVSSLFAQHLEPESVLSRLGYYLTQTVRSLRLQTGLSIPDIVLPAEEEAGPESLTHDLTSRLCHLADLLLAQEEAKDAGHLQEVKREIEKYVAAHYSEDIFLPGIAREMNYSNAYFSKLFKQCFQRNFITYLTDVRIGQAKDLIRGTDLTIREIGEQVGYKDPNYFTKVFRKVVGVSPSEFRDAGAG